MSFICSPEEFQAAMNPATTLRSARGIAKGVLDWLDAQEAFLEKYR